MTEDSARAALRSGTADCHDRVDGLFSGFDLTDPAQYGRFLSAQAAAHIAAETALDRDGAGAVLADWPARQRADALRADLADLGLAVPDLGSDVAFDEPAAVLGGVYVLEGSRLGGALLKRSVPAAFPSRFLGATNTGAWRALLALLDTRLDTPDARQTAIKAARAVFMLFEAAGRHSLGK